MQVKVKIKQIEGLALAAFSNSNHWVTMDAPEKLGGFAAGFRPMELLLTAVAGCVGMDVISILEKKRVKLQGFEMLVEAEQTEEHPQIFTEINLNYTLIGKNIKPADVERAIQLTDEKYCGAIAMIRDITKIRHNYQIKEPE